MDWNPGLYEQFRRHRERPARDLLGSISIEGPQLIYDLGCGTGRITRELAKRYPNAQVVGLDVSSAMLTRDSSDDPANLRFDLGDIAEWRPSVAPDLIFSNAALHWLPDHEVLFPRLVGNLSRGGHFHVQMPRNFSEPDHRVIEQIVHDDRWDGRLSSIWSEERVGSPEFYLDLLGPISAQLDVWETVYCQRLEGPNPVARWIEGAALRPYLPALGQDRDEFMKAVEEQILAAYPPGPDGTTLYPFRRLFVCGVART